MKKVKTLTAPSLDHIDTGIISWMLALVFTGITLCIVLPDLSKRMENRYRPSRSVRQMRNINSGRRKAA